MSLGNPITTSTGFGPSHTNEAPYGPAHVPSLCIQAGVPAGSEGVSEVLSLFPGYWCVLWRDCRRQGENACSHSWSALGTSAWLLV